MVRACQGTASIQAHPGLIDRHRMNVNVKTALSGNQPANHYTNEPRVLTLATINDYLQCSIQKTRATLMGFVSTDKT